MVDGRLRRAILPVALLLLAAGSAVAGGRAGASSGGEAVAPASGTPVLSARRVPELLARPAADAHLQAGLTALAARLPASSCLVTDEPTGGFEHQGDLPLIPASAMKMVVATAAIEHLGGDHRLVTTVRAAAPPVDGVVAGDLWLVGGGDPLLATAAYAASFRRQPQAFTPIEQLADAVVEAGVRVVRGSVVGDETRYDTDRYVRSWKPVYVTDNETGPMSALSVNDGFGIIEPEKQPATQPAIHAAAVFAQLLEERGVEVQGRPAAGEAPAGASVVAEQPSLPVSEIVAQMLRESDNQTAEMIVKELGAWSGRGGSTAAGTAVAVETLDRAGLPTGGVVIVDGSGLDRANRLTCRLLLALLQRDTGALLVPSLAVAGETGTLEHRFKQTPVAGRLLAKTGSLNGVAALTGEVTSTEGVVTRFAFIVNGIPTNQAGVVLQDALAELLVHHPPAEALAGLGPVDG